MVYGENREPIPAIPEPTVIFLINDLKVPLFPDPDALDVYNRTHYAWRVGPEVRDRAVYALSVRNSDKTVIGAFRIYAWHQDRHHDDRWWFHGRTARELNHVVGTSAARIKFSQNPFRRFLNGFNPDGDMSNE